MLLSNILDRLNLLEFLGFQVEESEFLNLERVYLPIGCVALGRLCAPGPGTIFCVVELVIGNTQLSNIYVRMRLCV